MTTYTTITDARVAPEAAGTTSLFTDLRDNLVAVLEGDASAPTMNGAIITNGTISQSKLQASSVGQSQLKTATGSVSTSSTVGDDLTLPGGEYGFYPRLWGSDGSAVSYWGYNSATASGIQSASVTGVTATTVITLSSSAGGTAYASQRYVQSSPPYDLGDGEIPLFVFLEVDRDGNVVSGYEAPEAPWHNNGPTCIRAHHYDKNGIGYRARKDLSEMPCTLEEAKADPVNLAEYMAAFAEAKEMFVPITQEEKNADMVIIPAPMVAQKGNTVIMIDPVSDLVHTLADAKDHDQLNILDLFHGGYMRIDNKRLNRRAPDGVPVHATRLKASKV